MPGESYRKRPRSLLLCLCDDLLNSNLLPGFLILHRRSGPFSVSKLVCFNKILSSVTTYKDVDENDPAFKCNHLVIPLVACVLARKLSQRYGFSRKLSHLCSASLLRKKTFTVLRPSWHIGERKTLRCQPSVKSPCLLPCLAPHCVPDQVCQLFAAAVPSAPVISLSYHVIIVVCIPLWTNVRGVDGFGD